MYNMCFFLIRLIMHVMSIKILSILNMVHFAGASDV
jgi:hypothetical protein